MYATATKQAKKLAEADMPPPQQSTTSSSERRDQTQQKQRLLQILQQKERAVRAGMTDISASYEPEGNLVDEADTWDPDKDDKIDVKYRIQSTKKKSAKYLPPLSAVKAAQEKKQLQKTHEEVKKPDALELVRQSIMKKHGAASLVGTPENKAAAKKAATQPKAKAKPTKSSPLGSYKIPGAGSDKSYSN